MSKIDSQQPTLFPDLQSLTAGLKSVFSRNGSSSDRLVVLDRQSNIHKATFPNEIVTCQLDDGSEVQLFCKYSAGRDHNVYGHRGGVAYEAAVYRYVLRPSEATIPAFYGAYTDPTTSQTWLLLEYLDKSVWFAMAPDSAGRNAAARWIGRFHAINEARLSSVPMPFLNVYDDEYYFGWARRTLIFARDLDQRFPWLAPLCERFEEFIPHLLALPRTVIHGEYYKKNVLFHNETIHPIDWESAAIALGEIDLATLTDSRRPTEIVRQAELEYQQARWPEGAPPDFEERLTAARLYMQFRWLGDRPEWTLDPSALLRFERLRSAGEQLGLI